MSEQPKRTRKYEGPAELMREGIDETSFNYANVVTSQRSIFENNYGEEGVGWEMVRPLVTGTFEQQQKAFADKKIGREVVQIVVTPDGKQYSIDVKHGGDSNEIS